MAQGVDVCVGVCRGLDDDGERKMVMMKERVLWSICIMRAALYQ